VALNCSEWPGCGCYHPPTPQEICQKDKTHQEIMGYAVKDSGQRQEYDSGMVRDVDTNKTQWALVADGPMLRRWAEHVTKGAQKYTPRNWMLASGDEEYQRFRESAFRHFIQWFEGETDEDHAAAVIFNVNGAEYVREALTEPKLFSEFEKELGGEEGSAPPQAASTEPILYKSITTNRPHRMDLLEGGPDRYYCAECGDWASAHKRVDS
jgi:hypothetical protein